MYQKATPHLRELALDPQDKTARDRISQLNYEIIEGNKVEGLTNTSKYRWSIPVSFFAPQYDLALKAFQTIRTDPSDATARKEITTLKSLIDEFIKRGHYPTAWSIPTAEDFLKSKDDEGSDSDDSDDEEEKKGPSEEAKQIIEKASRHKKPDFYEILGVSVDSNDDIKTTNAFRRAGCMLHPDYISGDDTKKTYKSRSYCSD